MISRNRAAFAACIAVLAIPASASAATKTVYMGPPSPKVGKAFQNVGVEVNDFFPHGTTVHVGDSIRFVLTEFHSVDLPARGGTPLPLVLPNGQKVANALDPAGAPFWFNGQDQLGFNPALMKSGFGKRFAYTRARAVRSGLFFGNRAPKPMTVRFARAGTFPYYCNVHPGMKGVVKVVSRSRGVPSAAAEKRRIAAQVARDLKLAKPLGRSQVPAGLIDVGRAGPHGLEFLGMLPGTVTVPVGTTLRFRMTKGSFEDHTATFGPGDPEKQPSSFLGKLAASLQSGNFDQSAVYLSDPPGAPAVLTPTFHGNGFWNTGVMDTSNATPLPSTGAVTFGAAGTYTFYCLIHPFMKGTVVVK